MYSRENLSKRKILVVGAGGVGTMAALALERSGIASVTAVLRSNYEKVMIDGFEIDSVNHGKLSNWRPTRVVNLVPGADPASPFDYVVVTMKTVPEINKVSEIIAPSITPGHTTIVLIQNGIYIEPPIIEAFPSCVVLSAASYIGAHERNGHVTHDDPDWCHIGAFHNPRLDPEYEREKLEDFAAVYNGSRVVNAEVVDDIQHYRWRKILWNGVYNPLCTITQLDSAAIRRMGGEYSLVRPAMIEIAAIARADGYDLGRGIVDEMVNVTPMELEFRPSMLVDHDKGNPLEVEVILGNALRVGQKHEIPTPVLENAYRLLRLIQARLLAGRGYVIEHPPAPARPDV